MPTEILAPEPTIPTPRTPTIVRRDEHTVEIVSDSGEGAQKCGQIFAAVSAKMGNGIWTVEIIPAEIQPPPRIPEGASGNRIRLGSGTVLICLEVGDHCTGNLCPVCAIPLEAVDARLAKSGLRPEVRRKVAGYCEACDRDTELVVSSGGYVTCTECGTTRRSTATRH